MNFIFADVRPTAKSAKILSRENFSPYGIVDMGHLHTIDSGHGTLAHNRQRTWDTCAIDSGHRALAYSGRD